MSKRLDTVTVLFQEFSSLMVRFLNAPEGSSNAENYSRAACLYSVSFGNLVPMSCSGRNPSLVLGAGAQVVWGLALLPTCFLPSLDTALCAYHGDARDQVNSKDGE